EAGHGHGGDTAGFEDPVQLLHRGGVVGEVLEDLGGHDPVEAVAGKGHVEGVALDGFGGGVLGCLVLGAHRGEHRLDLGEVIDVLVEGDDVGTATVDLEGVAASAAAEVEDAFARTDGEQGEVDGDQRSEE